MSLKSLLFPARECCKRSFYSAIVVNNSSNICVPLDNVTIRPVRFAWSKSSTFPHERFPGKDAIVAFLPAGKHATPWAHFPLRCFSTTKCVESNPDTSKVKDEDRKELLTGLAKMNQKRLLEEPDETGPHIIYKGLLSEQIKRLKLFSLTTSGFGIAMQPILIEQAAEISLIANMAMFGMVAFFTIGTPLLIQLIAKKYITDIVYDPNKDTYTATTYTFFLRKNHIVFKLEDIKLPEVPGPFTSITINRGDNKYSAYFVAPESFVKASHYGKFMGYDKPIDFHLTVDKSQTSTGTESRSRMS